MKIQNVGGASNQDALGCRGDLAGALAQPELSETGACPSTSLRTSKTLDHGSQRAAFLLAVALGRCRIFGVDPGERNLVLSAQTAIAAAKELSIQLRSLTQKIQALDVSADEKASCELEEELDTVFIFFRWADLWAAFVAIDEAYDACVTVHDEAGKEFRHRLLVLAEEAEVLDKEAQIRADLLCAVAQTNFLDNTRALLVEPYKSVLPWWLDGRLQVLAKYNKLREMSQT